jgi:hypothetical protein
MTTTCMPASAVWSGSSSRDAILIHGWAPSPPTVPRQGMRQGSDKEASMWVSWAGARQLIVGLVVATLAFVGLAVSVFLLTALFLD